ncbi:MAG: 30S ribosomal protein S15, partial [Halobacteriota archaeon]
MARMHTRRRGSSASDRPAVESPPDWSEGDAEAIEERVVELAEDGLSTAEIGVR